MPAKTLFDIIPELFRPGKAGAGATAVAGGDAGSIDLVNVAADQTAAAEETTDNIGKTRIAAEATAVAAEITDNIDKGKVMADEPAIGGKQFGNVQMTDAKRLKQEARREKQAARKKNEGEDDGSTRLCILDKVAVRRGKDTFEIVVDSPTGRKVIAMPANEVEQVLRDLETAIMVIRAQQ